MRGWLFSLINLTCYGIRDISASNRWKAVEQSTWGKTRQSVNRSTMHIYLYRCSLDSLLNRSAEMWTMMTKGKICLTYKYVFFFLELSSEREPDNGCFCGWFRAGRSTAIPVTWWQVKNRATKMPWWGITARVLFSLWKTGDLWIHFWICHFKFLLAFCQSSYFSPLLLHLLAGLSRRLSTVCWVKVGPKVACITGLVSGTKTRGGRESTDGFIITAPLCLSPSQTGINTSQVAQCLEMFVF